jgi:hypothetical protein
VGGDFPNDARQAGAATMLDVPGNEFHAFLNDCAAPLHDNAIDLSALPNFLASRLTVGN